MLKRGGRFLCLEFSQVDLPGLDRLYELFSDRVIPPIGRARHRRRRSPTSTSSSRIRKFPAPADVLGDDREAGFKRVDHTAFTGNIAALHGAWKL